jgi:hypothetical protein
MTTKRTVATTALLIAFQAYAAVPTIPDKHTRITDMHVSTINLTAGDTLTVYINGSGLETQCPTTILLSHKGNNHYKVNNQVGTGAWPRVSTFVLTDPGQYLVRSLATESAHLNDTEKTACGFHYSYGTSGIPGDNTVINVLDKPR